MSNLSIATLGCRGLKRKNRPQYGYLMAPKIVRNRPIEDFSKFPPRHPEKLSPRMNGCLQILNDFLNIKNFKFNWPFLAPVDVEGLELYNYYDIIKNPMDLATMKRKFDARQYANAEEFAADMDLIIDNARLYNADHSDVFSAAVCMKKVFEQRMKRIDQETLAEFGFLAPTTKNVVPLHFDFSLMNELKAAESDDIFLDAATLFLQSIVQDCLNAKLQRLNAKFKNTPIPEVPLKIKNLMNALNAAGCGLTSDQNQYHQNPLDNNDHLPTKTVVAPTEVVISENNSKYVLEYSFDFDDERNQEPMPIEDIQRFFEVLSTLPRLVFLQLGAIINSREPRWVGEEIDLTALKPATMREAKAFVTQFCENNSFSLKNSCGKNGTEACAVCECTSDAKR